MSSEARMGMVLPRNCRKWGSSALGGEKTLGVTTPALLRRREVTGIPRCQYRALPFPKTGAHCATRTHPCRRWGSRRPWRDRFRQPPPGPPGAATVRVCGRRSLGRLGRAPDPSAQQRWADLSLSSKLDPGKLDPGMRNPGPGPPQCRRTTDTITRGGGGGPTSGLVVMFRLGRGRPVKSRVHRCHRQTEMASRGGLPAWRFPGGVHRPLCSRVVRGSMACNSMHQQRWPLVLHITHLQLQRSTGRASLCLILPAIAGDP
mmetsp:Transcript_25942/g.62675  ORF Transcript_25942/g.62675 Transcript_25942/m.62675 type:complete len:260 (-) Transcript_25942:90-869(-)